MSDDDGDVIISAAIVSQRRQLLARARGLSGALFYSSISASLTSALIITCHDSERTQVVPEAAAVVMS